MSFFVVGLVLALTQVSLLPALLGVFFGALTEAYSLVDDNISYSTGVCTGYESGYLSDLKYYFN